MAQDTKPIQDVFRATVAGMAARAVNALIVLPLSVCCHIVLAAFGFVEEAAERDTLATRIGASPLRGTGR